MNSKDRTERPRSRGSERKSAGKSVWRVGGEKPERGSEPAERRTSKGDGFKKPGKYSDRPTGSRRTSDSERPQRFKTSSDSRPAKVWKKYSEGDGEPSKRGTREKTRYPKEKTRFSERGGESNSRSRYSGSESERRDNRDKGKFSKTPYGERKSERRYDSDRPSRRAVERKTPPSRPSKDGLIRLNKFVANSGVCSRREADEYIVAGLISVNGNIVTELGTKVKPDDEVRFNNERLKGEKKVYLVLNKPKNYVTTTDDPHAKHTVMELIEGACSERIYPVGRLDRNTTGVLLFTNDGDLAKRLTHPSYNKLKVYQVGLNRDLTRNDMQALLDGVELEDGMIQVDAIDYVGSQKSEVGLEIHSGRNRVVRRMFEKLGYEVEKLDRSYFAGLTKKRLRRGEWRLLTPQEADMLRIGSYE
ncbi:MAG: rRNA pseudouridine synthase [Prevotellaceae bacterium]|jgi:23S rRNA pseudouridine2605 synthase|nr:rRNA pseudouridine synthase [Prevotellaceae bacterium]